MKRSALYRRAARLVDSGVTRYSCIAISQYWTHLADAFEQGCARAEYEALFKPETYPEYDDWGWQWGRIGRHLDEDEDESKACRVLALLFMAAIAESEGQ